MCRIVKVSSLGFVDGQFFYDASVDGVEYADLRIYEESRKTKKVVQPTLTPIKEIVRPRIKLRGKNGVRCT